MGVSNAGEYFATARERYTIRLHRESGKPFPWTSDRVFQTSRFCNVHREDDKTTRWFREKLRSQLSGYHAVQATVAFRWFNRIETGEALFDLLQGEWSSEEARRRLQHRSPVVTGAYIIKGPDGYSKLDGVLYCIDKAIPTLQKNWSSWQTLQGAWEDLRTIYYLGPFMSYEVVSDLRWTDVLQSAPDINLWANAGPGCARGLGWVVHNRNDAFDSNSRDHQRLMLQYMRELLAMSREEEFWPQEWTKWEMREVEHWACEYDKYRRAQRGEKMKRRFQYGSS